MKTTKKQSGHARLKSLDRTVITLDVSREERELIRVAAAKAGMSTVAWVREIVVAASK